jgi:hypothetical protein
MHLLVPSTIKNVKVEFLGQSQCLTGQSQCLIIQSQCLTSQSQKNGQIQKTRQGQSQGQS